MFANRSPIMRTGILANVCDLREAQSATVEQGMFLAAFDKATPIVKPEPRLFSEARTDGMRRWAAIVAGIGASALALLAQDEAVRFQQAFERIDELARRSLKDGGAPGMSLAMMNRKGPLFQATYGYANNDSHELVRPDTLFGAGSIGKSMTSVVILLLRDAGKLDVQAPISKYLPWFQVNSTKPITAHHLLSHTSGFPDMRMDLTSPRYQAFWLTQSPVRFEPEKQYHLFERRL